MRPSTPVPGDSAIPLPPPHLRDGHRRYRASSVALQGNGIQRFNDLLHELYPDAPHLDADAVASVARWLLALPPHEAQAMLQARLGRMDELRELLADADWRAEPALALRINKLLDYVNGNDDLIPERTPIVGRLDDALLVELAWPCVADELDDYHDFCSFREDSGQHYDHHPGREDWLRSRLEEGALWEHLHRVHERHYIEPGPSDGVLRVV